MYGLSDGTVDDHASDNQHDSQTVPESMPITNDSDSEAGSAKMGYHHYH